MTVSQKGQSRRWVRSLTRRLHPGRQHGPCQLCQRDAKLYIDRVPPKGSPRLSQAEIARIAHVLQVPPATPRRPLHLPRTYRTLCTDCKHQRLGVHYDSALMDATSQVSRALATLTTPPATLTITLNPGAVTRAVLAHSLAANHQHQSDTLTAQLSAFILNDDAAFPTELDLYCWIYPYPQRLRHHETGTCVWALKYFPLGFLATWQQPPPVQNLANLTDYSGDANTRRVTLLLPLTNLPPADFPEKFAA